MIGDVIFFKKEDSLISKIISFMTKSEFTHVGLIVDYNKNTNIVTIIESNRFVNTRINDLSIDENKHVIFTTGNKTEKQIDYILKYAYQAIGTKYDYLHVLGIFISLLFKRKENALFNSKNRLMCSELVDVVYYKSGIERKNDKNIGEVTPQDLFYYYDFVIREEG